MTASCGLSRCLQQSISISSWPAEKGHTFLDLSNYNNYYTSKDCEPFLIWTLLLEAIFQITGFQTHFFASMNIGGTLLLLCNVKMWLKEQRARLSLMLMRMLMARRENGANRCNTEHRLTWGSLLHLTDASTELQCSAPQLLSITYSL